MTRAGYLDAAQRRLFRLITWPEGVHAALDTERGERPLATLVKSDGTLSAEHRLDVYANAYFYRILDVLRDDYPILAATLGETDFHDLATSYLAVHPSEHPSLRYIGARLASFLREGEAAAGVRARRPWAPDLATFEWAKGEVFDAEDAKTASRADLAGLPPERFERLDLVLVPAVRLATLAWPVDTLRAHSDAPAADASSLEPRSTHLVIFRRSEATIHRQIDALEHEALVRARAGLSFGSLCALIARERGDDAAPALAAAGLARWLDDGLLQPLHP